MDLLAQPFELPCGAVLPNRICKAAMTEGLGDALLRATPLHENLYRQWSEGGAGLLITGNVMIDRHILERPGNVAIDVTYPPSVSVQAKSALRRWASAATGAGNHCWMQISHAGRQSPRYVTRQPVAPSDVQLALLGNYAKPRALTEIEIRDFIDRFAKVAVIARETGFSGVQIHGAHGYLISAFLSPVTNRRTDIWGGSLPNRARFLLEGARHVVDQLGGALPADPEELRKIPGERAQPAGGTPAGGPGRGSGLNLVPGAELCCSGTPALCPAWAILPTCRLTNTYTHTENTHIRSARLHPEDDIPFLKIWLGWILKGGVVDTCTKLNSSRHASQLTLG